MTIKLEQIIEAIEMSDDFFTSFWDTKIGETVYLADPLLNGETDEVLAAEIENDSKRFLRFPTKYEIHEYRIMEDFIEQLSPGKVQSDLSYSIRGKGAFRRFKESIRYHDLEQPTETLLSVGAQKKGLHIRDKRNKRLLFALPYIAASCKPQKTPLQLRNATTAALFLPFTL